MTNEDQARRLRQHAYAIEQELVLLDQHRNESRVAYGLPSTQQIAASNERAAQAKLLRAQAARLDGDEAYALRLEKQAANVRLTGAYD
jgi:hypothetical protein